MKLIRTFALVGVLAILSGCSATNFVRPANETLTLGKSTTADITKLVGPPTSRKDDVQMNGEKIQIMNYFHLEGASFWGLIVPQRSLTYTLFNDTMVGEEFNSTFDVEKTEFDGSKAALIQKGKSNRADVIALMGKPSGEVIYPIIKARNGRGLVYAYTYARFAGMLTSYNNYLLVVTLDDQNVVTDVSYKIDNVEKIKG